MEQHRAPATPKRVLLVDDEPQVGEVLSIYLNQEMFEPVVCGMVADALEEMERRRPDVMILDITLPDGSGLDILRESLKGPHIPTIMLTARGSELDRVLGLELGADDYVVKPFLPRELVARVRAVLRRNTSGGDQGAASVIKIGDFEMDERAHEIHMRGVLAPITPAEFRILRVLVQNAGQALTRVQILDQVHDDGEIFERTLDRHVNNLRRKLEANPQEPEYLLTVYGVGYKFRKE